MDFDQILENTIVCKCNSVTCGDIRRAIEKSGARNEQDVALITLAGTQCNDCRRVLKSLLEQQLESKKEAVVF